MALPSREQALAFVFSWADIILESADGRIVLAEGAVKALLGYDSDSLTGRALTDIFVPGNRVLIEKVGVLLRRHGRVDEVDVQLRSTDGRRLPARLCGHALGSNGHLFLAIRSDLRMPGDDTVWPHDDQSGLYAGEKFHELAASRLREMAESGNTADLAVVDIAGLERICKNLPPDESETLMAAIGALIKANSIDGDSAAALSDGKYGFLAEPDHDTGALEREVADLVATMVPNHEVAVTGAKMTIGDVREIDEDSLTKGLMYTLQAVQNSGGGALQEMSRNMTSLIDQTVSQISAFRSLVTHRHFDVALHPIVGLRDGKIHHFEALCRFHGNRDASPFKVITFAEETGLIHQFDLTMAAKVIEWLSRQPRNNASFRAAVNVSGYSIGQPAYVEGLNRLLDLNDWLENRLIFEVTESSRMTDLEGADDFIQGIRKRGFEVCLDDFGAGAASFQYLSVLDVDVVKLDGSAVKNAQKAPKGRAFLSSLTDLCRRLKVFTVAEMVDTPKTLDFVRDCGCDFAQGYLFGKPSTDVRSFFPLPNQSLLWGGKGYV